MGQWEEIVHGNIKQKMRTCELSVATFNILIGYMLSLFFLVGHLLFTQSYECRLG